MVDNPQVSWCIALLQALLEREVVLSDSCSIPVLVAASPVLSLSAYKGFRAPASPVGCWLLAPVTCYFQVMSAPLEECG